MAIYRQSQDLYTAIMAIFDTMPAAKAGLLLLALTMIAFYATTFDALTMVAPAVPHRNRRNPDALLSCSGLLP